MSQLSEYQKQILSELCITNWHVREPDLLELGPVDSTTITSDATPTNSSPATAPSTTASSATTPSSIPSKPVRLDTASASDRIAQMQAAIGSAPSKTTPGHAASEIAPSQTASERAPKTEPVSDKAVEQTSASAEHIPAELAPTEHASIELIPVEHAPIEKVAPKEIARPLKQEVLILESERLPISDIVAAATSLNLPYRVIAQDQELEFEYKLLISAVRVSQVIAKENVIVESLSPQSKKRTWQALLNFNSDLLEQTSLKQTNLNQTSSDA